MSMSISQRQSFRAIIAGVVGLSVILSLGCERPPLRRRVPLSNEKLDTVEPVVKTQTKPKVTAKPKPQEPKPTKVVTVEIKKPVYIPKESATKFNLTAWKKRFTSTPTDVNKWHNNYTKGIHGGWFNGKSDDCAKNYRLTWGPLGLHTHMHDSSWSMETAFKARWPKLLLTDRDELITNAIEVTKVLPGSPAEGHLEVGDLIVEFNGQAFQSASSMRVTNKYKHQNSRSLAMHAGEILDEAEGLGYVHFGIIRPSSLGDKTKNLKAPKSSWKELTKTNELKSGSNEFQKIEVELGEAELLKLIVERTTDVIHGCGARWITPQFIDANGDIIDMIQIPPISQSTGYGRIVIRKEPIEINGKQVAGTIDTHSDSVFLYKIPKGVTHFRATLQRTNPNARGFVGRIEAGKQSFLPEEIRNLVKYVEFEIPKIGQFKGNIYSCPKTRNIADMQAAWLVANQQKDGSWRRDFGYTKNHYDTSWAGLGLMSMGEAKYDKAIRRAAEYVAFSGTHDSWTISGAMTLLFLSEYWLRYKDDSVLPAIRLWADRIKGYMAGDNTAGHGYNLGYRGGGVSVGGSNLILALVAANLTPVDIDTKIIDDMLEMTQQLAPDGYVPYGRFRNGAPSWEPNLDGAGTYSGRHGPVLIASKIYGGPKLFTENCASMYINGPVGGIDQGHATQTLSMQWAFPAIAYIDLDAYSRHLKALAWKITLLRCFDGGFAQNAYRLEYQGGESLLNYALRTGGWLVSLNAYKHNLAMTGQAKYKGARLKNNPPTYHHDAKMHGYYLRNWSVAAAALGRSCPSALRKQVRALASMKMGKGLHKRLYDFLQAKAPSIAKSILASRAKSPLKQYAAEMVLGIDHRIHLKYGDDENATEFAFTAQQAFEGLCAGLSGNAATGWVKQMKLPMNGSVEIIDKKNKLGQPIKFAFSPDGVKRWNSSHTQEKTFKIKSAKNDKFELDAVFSYTVGDMEFNYTRKILFGERELWGNGEKLRPLTNDRVVWVNGSLADDQIGWDLSFDLENGRHIAAAGQGNEVAIHKRDSRRKITSWISPRDASLMKGSLCQFGYTSGWQNIEARISEVRLLKEAKPIQKIKSVTTDIGKVKALSALIDTDKDTTLKLSCPKDKEVVSINLELTRSAKLHALDLRLSGQHNRWGYDVVIKAHVNGEWKSIYWGRSSDKRFRLIPVKSKKLKIEIKRGNKSAEEISIGTLRVY